MRRGAQLLLGLGVGAVLASTAPVQAQVVLRSPQEIQQCLCTERSVSALAQDVVVRNRIYEERRRQVEQLEAEVASRRNQVNVSVPTEVEAFRQLLQQRDQAVDAFATDVTRDYSDAVNAYNRRVSEFNTSCAGKSYDPDVLAQVRQSLVCPQP